jgi:8-oxo-dGTP diphosphatase
MNDGEEINKKSNNYVPEAGAIAYRLSESQEPEILIVRSKKNPIHWIFPKGHIEEGESLRQTAERELLEEGGVEGEATDEIGPLEYMYGNDRIHVTYFAIRFGRIGCTGEFGRQPQWMPIGDALRKLSFQSTRALLEKAIPIIKQRLFI